MGSAEGEQKSRVREYGWVVQRVRMSRRPESTDGQCRELVAA